MTEKAVAALLGVSEGTVSRWEAGDRVLKSEYVVALADHYGCTTDFILGRAPAPQGYYDEAAALAQALTQLAGDLKSGRLPVPGQGRSGD